MRALEEEIQSLRRKGAVEPASLIWVLQLHVCGHLSSISPP